MMLEIRATLLILTFLPVTVTAIFVVLAFHQLGWGNVGKWLSFGFVTLSAYLVISLINVVAVTDSDDLLIILAASLRLMGWICIATGFVYLWVEADRSIP